MITSPEASSSSSPMMRIGFLSALMVHTPSLYDLDLASLDAAGDSLDVAAPAAPAVGHVAAEGADDHPPDDLILAHPPVMLPHLSPSLADADDLGGLHQASVRHDPDGRPPLGLHDVAEDVGHPLDLHR